MTVPAAPPQAISRRAYVALVISSILWASMHPAAKPIVGEVSPLLLTASRATIAWVVLTGFLIAGRRGADLLRTLRRHPVEIVVLGLTSFVFSSLLAMLALELLPASVNGLLNNLSPLWLAIGTVAIVRPADSRRFVLGGCIAFVGFALVMLRDASPSEIFDFQSIDPLGVAYSIASSLVIALSTVVGRRLMVKTDPIVTTALATGCASAFLLVVAGLGPGVGPLITAPIGTMAVLVYLGIGCTVLNFALWFTALKEVPAARAAPFQYLIPLFGVAFSAVFLGEPLTPPLLVGTALLVGGIVVIQQGPSVPGASYAATDDGGAAQ